MEWRYATESSLSPVCSDWAIVRSYIITCVDPGANSFGLLSLNVTCSCLFEARQAMVLRRGENRLSREIDKQLKNFVFLEKIRKYSRPCTNRTPNGNQKISAIFQVPWQ